MTLAVVCLLAVGVLAFAERSTQHIPFAVAAQGLLAAALSFVVDDLERAILLSSIVAVTITGASILKYDHSGLKLTATDLPLVAAGTVPFFITQYPRAVLAAAAGGVGVVLAMVATEHYAAGPPASAELRIALLGLAVTGCALTYRIGGGAARFRSGAAARKGFFSTFMASLVDTVSWRQAGRFALSDIASEPLPLVAAIPARTSDYPDIIVIQHESIFDPRVYGLPVEPIVDAFLSPRDAQYGSLNVDIFGGGSWQSEFSLLTGLSSASFGSSGYFLFQRGVGRFHHSLPRSLTALGYQTMLASSCRRSFLNYDEFYRSIGIGERLFTEDFPPPFDARGFEATCSDALFLPAAVDAFAGRIAADPAPRFLYALTNFNHGPHSRKQIGRASCRERV